jgi:hypothetical protein
MASIPFPSSQGWTSTDYLQVAIFSLLVKAAINKGLVPERGGSVK